MHRTLTVVISLTALARFREGTVQNQGFLDGFRLADKEGIIRKPVDYRDTFLESGII